jgi:hypothetical protein
LILLKWYAHHVKLFEDIFEAEYYGSPPPGLMLIGRNWCLFSKERATGSVPGRAGKLLRKTLKNTWNPSAPNERAGLGVS